MLVSYNWLKELVDLEGITPEELADKMSRSGIEVEGIDIPEEGLKKIVVGRVLECVPHPNSDHLSICQVDVGEEEPYQIVCGAPNVKAGKNVIVALPNSRITGNVKIKKGKMRGEVSLGMICSLQELGYSDSVIPKAYAEGIYFLPEEAKAGDPVFPYLEMDDAIIELSVTPNRADALSMRGVAHEVAAIYDRKLTLETNEQPLSINESEALISVHAEDTDATPYYGMRIIKDVTIQESPMWLQTRLMNEGIRPINNVVDVTNYTLLLFGQPQHAFDYDKLKSKEISVRYAYEGEKIVTLDETERVLNTNDLVISNDNQAIALAGVMGGLDTEVTDKTQTIALETAIFNPICIRKTARRLGLSSESSRRFERGINWDDVQTASLFSAQLIAELGGGTIVSEEALIEHTMPKVPTITITLDKINNALGTSLSLEEVQAIFEKLGFDLNVMNQTFEVSVPLRRWDITIEADLIEEVARIYGYDHLPSTLPSGNSNPGTLTFEQKTTRLVRQFLEGKGLNEAISYALTNEQASTRFVIGSSNAASVKLDFPMSEDRSVLRQNIMNGLLENTAYNVARNSAGVSFYEIGKVFEETSPGELPNETTHLGITMFGQWINQTWQNTQEKVDFYSLKGIIESLVDQLGLSDRVSYEPVSDLESMHPGRTAYVKIDNETVGFLGQVHPKTADLYNLNEVYGAEINMDQLVSYLTTEMTFNEFGKYPSVKRDISILADVSVMHSEIVSVIQSCGGRYLNQVHLFDVYKGEKLGLNKQSLAYSLTFVNHEDTLVDEEISKVMSKIEAELSDKLGVEIR